MLVFQSVVTLKPETFVSVKSTDGTPGRVDLYCEVNNAHYARIQAPNHSDFSGNITLTLPNSTGTLLLSNGDGSQLTGIDGTLDTWLYALVDFII